jgi:uncharacterized protein (DUF952 family)
VAREIQQCHQLAVPRDVQTLVFKIVAGDEWAAACRSGVYAGSADDNRDGFVHLSARHQLQGTAARHFRGRKGLLLAAFAADALGPALKWEPSRGGDLFPHLYGGLPTGLALWTRPLTLGEDGIPILPDEPRQC